jgi:hypothetical protein
MFLSAAIYHKTSYISVLSGSEPTRKGGVMSLSGVPIFRIRQSTDNRRRARSMCSVQGEKVEDAAARRTIEVFKHDILPQTAGEEIGG